MQGGGQGPTEAYRWPQACHPQFGTCGVFNVERIGSLRNIALSHMYAD